MEKKWSRHVGHLEEDGLHGWCASCPPDVRHQAIERTVRADSYATAVRRLNFLANVANRRDNGSLHRVAREDVEWTERQEKDTREGEDDTRGRQGEYHRVRGYRREAGERVRPHLARNPRR
ncbi:MAG: hypothetical protein ACLQD8_00350 [Thermoplasmata archaeon]|jgi:hypothetical protein|nr:hypothetical protein [Thermoplasmata archaeon]